MSRFWSPFVTTLAPYTPGEQPKDRRFIKLNTNENPYGPAPAALAAITRAAEDLRLYPDPSAEALRMAISGRLGLVPENVFAGNGSDEVLAHAFNAFFHGKGEVLFPDVTYSFYKVWCGLYGLPYREVPLDSAFQIDPAAYAKAGGVVIANPNAPTGLPLPLSAVEAILRQNPDGVVILDEAYVDFGAESAAALVPHYDNLLVVQTFSKSRSLAGLRVGFALGQPHLIEALNRVKDSFNSYPLGRPQQAGALAAWEETDWFDRTRGQVMATRDAMAERLTAQGFRVLPSAANFVFASPPGRPAVQMLAGLRDRGVLVRYFAVERIADWLRISVGTEAEAQALTEATAALLA